MGWRTAAAATILKNQIKQRVKSQLGKDVQAGDQDTLIGYYLDDSLRAIAGAHAWSWRRLEPETLHTKGTAVSTVAIPAHIDRYAKVVLYQTQTKEYVDKHKHKPLEAIPPWEYARRATQGASSADELEAFTVLDDDFYFYPTIKVTANSVEMIAHILSDQLTDATPIVGLWRRVPNNFRKVLEWETLHGIEILESSEKWGQKVWAEKGAIPLLIAEDKTAFRGGGN